jgi:dTDP-glucose 4,6-dehydratase
MREWIHVSDHSFGIQCALENGTPGGIYNIGSGTHLSNNDLAEQIIRILGYENQKKEYVQDRKGHDLRYSIDSKRIESLGFIARTNFIQGLTDTIDWYMANPTWWNKSGIEPKL